MKKLLLLPLAIVAMTSCVKQAGKPAVTIADDAPAAAYDINKAFTMSNKEDSTLLEDEGKYKQYVTLYDASGKYSVNVSVSSDDKDVFEEEITNIRKNLRIAVLYNKTDKPADNADGQDETNTTAEVKASKNITCIVTSTNLPQDATGFSFTYFKPKPATYDAPGEEGPISPAYGYNVGVYYMTLANGMVTFNHGAGNIFVIREYKNSWLNTSWSNWGNTTLTPGTNDNYCIKNKNRIRVRVYFNYGTSQTCGVYGSSSC